MSGDFHSDNQEPVTTVLGDLPKFSKEYNETSIPPQEMLLCSTLVKDAKKGLRSDYETSPKCVTLYNLYNYSGFFGLLYLFIAIHHLVAICEKPAVQGFELPFWVTMLIESLCLVYYLFRLFHAASFLPGERFWTDKKNVVILVTIILTVIDMVIYIGMMHSSVATSAIRWSRPLRPLFIINFRENNQIRRAFRNIRKTLPDILSVLILFFLSISLFALMSTKLFGKKSLTYPDGSPYFNTFLSSYFDLYVLVTTANNPDIMMPAYDTNRWAAIFFILFLIICLYIFMNIILAVIYNNYRKHLKNEVQDIIDMKKKSLKQAFDIIKETIGGKSVVTSKKFEILMSRVQPGSSPMLVKILWFVLAKNEDNTLNEEDFFNLADLLNVGVSEIRDKKNVFHKMMPGCYNSTFSKTFRIFVAHRFFRYTFDALILLNAILMGFDITQAEWVFLVLFTFEILAKVYTFGPKEFSRKLWNVFDTLVIGLAVIATIVEYSMGSSETEKMNTLDIILVLRVLRLVKIIGSIERFQVIVSTIMNLGPSISTYGGILLVVFYFYAILGMELFQNKFFYQGYGNGTQDCGNPKLHGSQFYQNHYCSNNFNDLLSSLVLLFELMVVNQWHVLASGFVAVTNEAARLYFFVFHLTCVIIVLNIFTAFVIEAFILEYSHSQSRLETTIERKIKEMGLQFGTKSAKPSSKLTDKNDLVSNSDLDLAVDSDHNVEETTTDASAQPSNLPNFSHETAIRFHISKKRNIENLLLRMFESELD